MKHVFEFLLGVFCFLVIFAIAFVLSTLFWGLVVKLICWVLGIAFNLVVPAIIGFVNICINVSKNGVFEKSMEWAEKIVEG